MKLLDLFYESKLNFLQKKFVSKSFFSFAMVCRAGRHSEIYELVFFKKTLLSGNEMVKKPNTYFYSKFGQTEKKKIFLHLNQTINSSPFYSFGNVSNVILLLHI